MLAIAAFALSGGCATFLFKPLREARFIDMNGKVIHVEYGKEKRTTTMANGLVCTFEDKVRVTFPNGDRDVLYQTLSASGLRYTSENGKILLIEKGLSCALVRKGQVVFEGIRCGR